MTEDDLKRRYPLGTRVKETKGNYGAPSSRTYEVVGHHRGSVVLRDPATGTTHHVRGENVRRYSTRRDVLKGRRG